MTVNFQSARTWAVLFLICARGAMATGAEDSALLRGVITDAVTGRPTPCTVAITDAHGQIVQESAAFKAGFRSGGGFEKQLPPGPTRIRVTRGFETRDVTNNVVLRSGETTTIKVVLERMVDLRQRGWFAGDSHAHMIHGEKNIPVDFDFVALTARAEDLQYMSVAQAWQLDDPTPERLERELQQRSTPDCLLAWNMEMPKNYLQGDAGRCLGHCWNLSMRGRTADGLDVIKLLSDASAADYENTKPSFANFESHELIHAQGGVAFYSHPLRWWLGPWGGRGGYPKRERMRVSNMAVELPLDTVIGPTYDGLDVITSGGELEANAKAFALWALLLNHGYRLAATASSDACFDRPGGGVPGSARTYTYLTNGFSWAAVARATAAGRTFVTTGPLLLATLAGATPGSSLPADGQPRTLQIEAWASGQGSGGLRSLDILRNGIVFQQIALGSALAACQTNLVIRESEQSWYCVRVSGSSALQRASTGAFYFDKGPVQAPVPTSACVRVRVIDARTGALLPATLTEVSYQATCAHPGKQHRLEQGTATLSIPAIMRLRAEAPGYAALTHSPFLDYPPLLEAVTRLEAKDLLDWKTFEKMRALLGEVALTFALEPQRP